jgi:hypothetical protein
MKKIAFALVLLVTLIVAGAAVAKDKKKAPSWWHSSVTVENHSDYAIHHLYFTPANSLSWGKDQLGSDVLFPNEQATLKGLECDVYDLKFVDDEGDECIVEDIDLCLEKAVWSLDNDDLAACSGFEK